MDIVCVIDVVQNSNLSHRKRALEEVKQASMMVNANLFIVSVVKQFSILFLSTTILLMSYFYKHFSLKN